VIEELSELGLTAEALRNKHVNSALVNFQGMILAK
jgi:hypothetical protein